MGVYAVLGRKPWIYITVHFILRLVESAVFKYLECVINYPKCVANMLVMAYQRKTPSVSRSVTDIEMPNSNSVEAQEGEN
jgi:hypothetical protein